LAFVFTVSGYGQSKCPATKNNLKGIAKISNINSNFAKDVSCRIGSYSGNITGLAYSENESDKVTAVTVQQSNGKRFIIHLFDEDLLDCFSESDKRNLKNQLVKNAKVKITAYACGAGGNSDLTISSIEFRGK